MVVLGGLGGPVLVSCGSLLLVALGALVVSEVLVVSVVLVVTLAV